MPYIARVVDQEKTSEGVEVVVRVTGVGGKEGPMRRRAKARALYASGLLPQFSRSGALFDKEMSSGDMARVDKMIDEAKDSRIFAQLQKTMSVRSKKEVSEEKVEEVFGRGFFGIVDTYDYHYLVSSTTSF